MEKCPVVRVRLHVICTSTGAINAEFTLFFMQPGGFLPVNPVFSYSIDTESLGPLVRTEQQITHNQPVEVKR